MIKHVLRIQGINVLKKRSQESIRGGMHNCNIARKCFSSSECCSGVCGVERIINGKPILVAVCASS